MYAMIGFEWTAVKFFWYLFFMYFTLSYYTFYGMMTVGLTPNYNVASVVSTAFYSIWNLFSGFIIPRTVSILTFLKVILLTFSLLQQGFCLNNLTTNYRKTRTKTKLCSCFS